MLGMLLEHLSLEGEEGSGGPDDEELRDVDQNRILFNRVGVVFKFAEGALQQLDRLFCTLELLLSSNSSTLPSFRGIFLLS